MKFSEDYFLRGKDGLSGFKDDPERLMEYLERTYRAHLWVELPALVKKMEAICRDKSLHYPHLQEVLLHLRLLHETLLHHLLSEEVVLFALLKNPDRESESQFAPGGSLKELIGLLEEEHTILKEGLLRVRTLCKGYDLSFKDAFLPELYARLERCEKLILEHIFLESHFLFEKFLKK